jgi:hypothetical protein
MEFPVSGKIVFIDSDDLLLVSQYKWHVNSKGYVFHQIRSCGKNLGVIFMHRLIMGLTDGSVLCDHKNRNPLDNRRENLRIATRTENQRNRRGHPGCSSKYKGVYIQRKKGRPNYRDIRFKIKINNDVYTKGGFKTEEQAAIAYNEMALKHFGEFAFLNTI